MSTSTASTSAATSPPRATASRRASAPESRSRCDRPARSGARSSALPRLRQGYRCRRCAPCHQVRSRAVPPSPPNPVPMRRARTHGSRMPPSHQSIPPKGLILMVVQARRTRAPGGSRRPGNKHRLRGGRQRGLARNPKVLVLVHLWSSWLSCSPCLQRSRRRCCCANIFRYLF